MVTRKLPSILKPRLTWRYIACFAAVVYVSYCFLFVMHLLSSDLPPYTGEYDVGAIDIEVPVEERNIGKAVFRDSGESAFKVSKKNDRMKIRKT